MKLFGVKDVEKCVICLEEREAVRSLTHRSFFLFGQDKENPHCIVPCGHTFCGRCASALGVEPGYGVHAFNQYLMITFTYFHCKGLKSMPLPTSQEEADPGIRAALSEDVL